MVSSAQEQCCRAPTPVGQNNRFILSTFGCEIRLIARERLRYILREVNERWALSVLARRLAE
jgi:hypothetical protein